MWQRMISLDRRWIFLAIGLAVLLPYAAKKALPLGTANKRTQDVYDTVEKLPPGSAIIIAPDYGPASMPEVHPMALALTRHALKRNLRVLLLTINVQGALLIEDILKQIQADAEFKAKKDGTDYVNLGFQPGGYLAVLGIGDDITKAFPKDARGRPTPTLPVLKGVHNYKQIPLVVALESTTAASTWIFYAHEKFGVPLAMGVTAVMATDYYPYLNTGQILGLINGMKGAAEYEALVGRPDKAVLGMTAQSISHIVIILFVILGNIGYFATRPRRRLGQR
jgi:hypothetical protein